MQTKLVRNGVRLTAAAVATLILAGCQTATPYQPLAPNARSRGGYTDQQIEPNRFRVTFAGNSMTSRETVETYLLYRAAQLTIDRGFDWFEMADRNTERNSNTYVTQPFGPGPYGYWGPSWRYGRRGSGWRNWDPYWGNPFWAGSVDVTTVTRYEAAAEIVMGRGPKPSNNVRAFDARAVVVNLAPRVQTPR
ncbi:CC0125/CC1285 family lipoprotein [Sphingomonas sp.]|uniref:CC0125/CC1285 family lipoprotein n=1 Tax=Sphingomonas sp. TaxID=28214 RepID=UPI003B3AE0A6